MTLVYTLFYTKSDLQELFRKDCWRLIVIPRMMNHTQNIDGWSRTYHWLKNRLSMETISDSKSEIPLSLTGNLCTMKMNVVMPPPGEFTKPYTYSKRRSWCVQHFAVEFWSRQRKEFLQSLQVRQIWKQRIQNLAIAHQIVLLEDDCHQNQWLMENEFDSLTDGAMAKLAKWVKMGSQKKWCDMNLILYNSII